MNASRFCPVSATCSVKLAAGATVFGFPVRLIEEPVVAERLSQPGSVEPEATDQV